jgi:multiple sugar transport system permease protein
MIAVSRLRSGKRRVTPGRVAAWMGLGLAVVITLFPFWWMVRTALTSPAYLYGPLFNFRWHSLLPSHTTLVNFKRVFGLASAKDLATLPNNLSRAPFHYWEYLKSSLIVATLVTVGQVFFSAMAAYAFARLRFRGRDTLFVVFLSALLVPAIFTLIPNFILIKQLGWINTYQGIVAPTFLMTPFAVFFLRQFFLSINRSIEEAAIVDGARYDQIFFKLILPIARAPVVTLMILTFITTWNDYLWPLVVAQDPKHEVLTVALSTFRQSQPNGAIDWTALMAGNLAGILPIVVLFLLSSRRIIDSIQFTGVR